MFTFGMNVSNPFFFLKGELITPGASVYRYADGVLIVVLSRS